MTIYQGTVTRRVTKVRRRNVATQKQDNDIHTKNYSHKDHGNIPGNGGVEHLGLQ